MSWLHDLSYVLGGAVFANAIPHLVSGLTGRAFQSPFAKPPGEGLSSATVNAPWGFFNLVVAYLLVLRVGDFDPRGEEDIVALGLGFRLAAILTARVFGRPRGGAAPGASPPS